MTRIHNQEFVSSKLLNVIKSISYYIEKENIGSQFGNTKKYLKTRLSFLMRLFL